jgi:hypothetical protein
MASHEYHHGDTAPVWLAAYSKAQEKGNTFEFASGNHYGPESSLVQIAGTRGEKRNNASPEKFA